MIVHTHCGVLLLTVFSSFEKVPHLATLGSKSIEPTEFICWNDWVSAARPCVPILLEVRKGRGQVWVTVSGHMMMKVRVSPCLSVVQGWSGGVQDTAADRQHSGEESSHQAGTCEPARLRSTQRSVGIQHALTRRVLLTFCTVCTHWW